MVIVDSKTGTEVARLERENGAVIALDVAPAGKRLLVGWREGPILIVSLPDGVEVATLPPIAWAGGEAFFLSDEVVVSVGRWGNPSSGSPTLANASPSQSPPRRSGSPMCEDGQVTGSKSGLAVLRCASPTKDGAPALAKVAPASPDLLAAWLKPRV